MKKILTAIVLMTLVAATGYSQMRFGMKLEPSLNWYKPDNLKKYDNTGLAPKLSYGLMLEFPLSGNASFLSGLEVTGDGGKLAFKDSVYYFLNSDEEFIQPADELFTDADALTRLYKLEERSYKNSYVTLPLILKMKTNEIGAMTYFGQFGFMPSIRWKSRVDDKVINALMQEAENKALDNVKDMAGVIVGLNVGAGAEMNLSGSTSVVFGLNFNPGFLNAVQKNSEYVWRAATNGTDITEAIEQKATNSRISLTLGVLF